MNKRKELIKNEIINEKVHRVIDGLTGCVKSAEGKEVMRNIFLRQDFYDKTSQDQREKMKLIVDDMNDEFIEDFYINDNESIIFNPFSERGYSFEIIEIISILNNIDEVIKILIKNISNRRNSTAIILKAIINLCIREGKISNADILRYCNLDSKELAYEMVSLNGNTLTPKVGMSEALNFITKDQFLLNKNWEKFIYDTKFLRMFLEKKKTLSIKDYVKRDKRNLFLGSFLGNNEKRISIINLFLNSIASEILSSEAKNDYEVTLIVDNVDSLKDVKNIQELFYKNKVDETRYYIGKTSVIKKRIFPNVFL